MPSQPLVRTSGASALLLAGLAFAFAATVATAQTGPFVHSQPYFVSPFGGPGVNILQGQIWIDVNGSGLNDAGDTFHPIPDGLETGWSFRLTPSRRVMVAFTSNGSMCPGTATNLRLYSVPTTNGTAFPQLGIQRTLNGCIQDVGFSDNPANAVRTAFFREPADGSGNARILWWDLVGGVSAFSPFPYQTGFGFIEFAPYGTMAWVQHDIDNGFGTAFYSLVELCPPQLGQASQPGLSSPDVLHAHVENAGARDAIAAGGLVVVARTSGGTQAGSFNYDDCALPPPLTGACCLPGGGCLGGTTQTECTSELGGTWQGASSTCDPSPCPPPPAPELSVSLEGPLDVEVGAVFVYSLLASNDGTGSATGVTVTDSLPALMSFVFASDGGTFDPFSRRVTWNLGTMNPGAARPLFLGVRAPCSGGTVTNGNWRIAAEDVGAVAGGPPVVTTLDPPNTTPMVIVLNSFPLSPVPLQTGGVVRHAVQLTNSTGVTRSGIRFLFGASASSTVSTIVDSAGGSMTRIGVTWQWEGSFGPGQTRTIVWETTISECRSTAPALERINGVGIISVAHRCGQNLGFASTTQAFDIAGSPFAVRLETTSPSAAQAAGSSWITVARPGAPVDFALRYIHSGSATAPVCSMAVQIPVEMDPPANPFIGSPPAGTSYDPILRVIRWSGVPPPADSVVVAFRVSLPGTGCLQNLLAQGWHGACFPPATQTLGVMGVPEPPAGAHLVGLNPSDGLYTWVPGTGVWRALACGSFANSSGVGRAPDGTLWVAGSPVWRIHPGTLDFKIYPPTFASSTLTLDYPFDVAADPRDSSLVWVGYQVGLGLRVRRWNPRTNVATFILNDPVANQYGPGNSVAVSPDGFIGVQTANALLRIDPANPPGFQATTAASQSAQNFGGIALDLDGNYLAPEAGPSTRRLFKLDRTSGAFTTLADLHAAFPPGQGLSGGVVTLPDQRVYVASSESQMVEVDRAGGNAMTSRPALVAFTDLLYVDGPTVDAPDPTAGPAPAALALSAAVPNPFGTGTSLRFTLPRAGHVSLDVYDLVGRRVRSLERGDFVAGSHVARWNGRGDDGERLRAGLYFVRLRTDGEQLTTQVVLSP